MIRNAFLATALLASPSFARPIAPMPSGGLSITCPPLAKFECGSPTDPGTLGQPTVTTDCPGDVTATYVDVPVSVGCPADRFQLAFQRVWTATDACGNSASCAQDVHVVRQSWALDIKPTSCPNPINVGSNGGNAAVSIAILGRAGQDVTRIDPASVRIWREGCASGPVSPLDASYQDVAAPWEGGDVCGCTTAGPDGILDLRLKFRRQSLVQGLGLASLPQGSYVRLVVSARLYDGCELIATDCVRIQ